MPKPPTGPAAMIRCTLLAGSLLCLPSLVIAQAPPTSTAFNFEVERLAEGVYAVMRTDPPGLMFEANSGFIIGDGDVIVVDGGSNPESATAVVAALREVTSLPVRFVVNTHWHDDHMMGNEVYRDAFPDVEFVAHVSTREDMAADGAAFRQQFLEQGPGTIGYLRGLLDSNKSLGSGELTAEERESHLSSIALAERYMAQAPGFRITPPTVEVEDRLVLRQGDRTIEVRYLGRGHTRGDLIVHLPRERIAFTGDLVSWPVPLVGTTSYPLEFGATLEKLLALEPAAIVPGHGPVLRDDAYVRLVIRLLDSVKRQAEAAVSRGETLEQARRSVDLEEFADAFAGSSPVRRILFSQYVADPAVARAYEAASASRP